MLDPLQVVLVDLRLSGGLQTADRTQHPQLHGSQAHSAGFLVQLFTECPVDDGELQTKRHFAHSAPPLINK